MAGQVGLYDPSINNGVRRIGFDKDGVLSHFSPGYQRVITELSGRDLFQPGDAENPPCWDWDLLRGYTKEERKAAFDHIARHPTFWYDCQPLSGVWELRASGVLDSIHECYYITNRAGFRVKRQSEAWLVRWLELYGQDRQPTVVIHGHRQKGYIARSLQLDAYIDDNSDNVMDCLLLAPNCDVRMLTTSYNVNLPSAEEWATKNKALLIEAQGGETGNEVNIARTLLEKADRSRVGSVGEFLRAINVGRLEPVAH